MGALKPFPVASIYLDIFGGGGAGKSHLIRSVDQTAVKTFTYGPSSPGSPVVLKLAPTGVSAINIDGLVINSALTIPQKVFGEHIGSLLHEGLSGLRNRLKDLKLIITDGFKSNAKKCS